MKKQIVVDRGDVQRIAKAMGCTREMVSKSLHFQKHSRLAEKIRFYAKKEYGGCEVGGEKHDEASQGQNEASQGRLE
jgi:hypothetical protein